MLAIEAGQVDVVDYLLSHGADPAAKDASGETALKIARRGKDAKLAAKTIETAIQVQTDYAKSAYEGFVARSTKINEIFTKIASEAFKPAQNAFSLTTKQ